MENNFNQNTPVPEEPTQDASQETTAQAAPETAPKPPVKVRRVGTFSLGLMLVAIGAIQLAQIFMPNVNVLSVVKYAPMVLIVLGIEVLIYAARPDVKIKYDVISIFLCIIIMLTAGASGAVAAVAQAFTPENVTKRVTTEEQYKKTVQKALSNIPNAHDFVHDYSIDVSSESWFMDMPVGTMHATVYLTMNYGAQTTAEEFVRDCMKVMDAVNATDIPVEYYRFDVDQSNLTDGEVWSVWLDEWEMHGNLQNIAAHVDTMYYVDGDAYTSLDDVPKKDGDELLNRYMAAFGTNPLTDYQNEYGTVEFGDELDEWEMHGNLQNIAAHVDTMYYVDGDAYTSLDDVPKKDGDELLNRYMAAFGTNPLTDYQNEYGTVEFGDKLEEYMQNRVENEAGQDLTDTDNAGKTAASEETPAAQDDVTMEATEPAAGAAEAASENAN